MSYALVPLASALSQQESTPGLRASVGFPVALVVMAVVFTVYALVHRARNKRKQDHERAQPTVRRASSSSCPAWARTSGSARSVSAA